MASKNNIPIKKSWGQNFLIDKNTINKIIHVINPSNNDTILEIGPGHGALTKELLSLSKKVYAVEIDPMLCTQLNNQYKKLLLFPDNQDSLLAMVHIFQKKF